MNILQVAPPWFKTPPEGYGGTEWVVYNLTEELVRAGHNVTLFATGNSRTSAKLKYVFEKGLKEENISWNAALPAELHFHQASKIANNYDLVHFHMSADQDLSLLPFLETISVPCVVTQHSQFPYDKFSDMNEYYIKHYAKNTKIISISRSMEARMPKAFNSLGVVYNGIGLNQFEYHEHATGDYFVWLGTIEPKKGVKDMILAIKETPFKLIMAGKTDYDPSYFENEIKPLIDNDQIQFIGPVNAAQRNDLLSNARGFLNYLQWDEPFGLVMVESMACGTPVIAMARGAAKEVIENKKTGFLTTTKEEFIESMYMIDHIKRADCRQHIANNFSAQAMAVNYMRVYNLLVAQKQRRNLFQEFRKKYRLNLPLR